MSKFIITVLLLFNIQEKFTEWTSEYDNRKYQVKINDKKIRISVNGNEYTYILKKLNKKSVFKENNEYYYFTIEKNKLRFYYYEKKYRRDVDEMITLLFIKKNPD